MTINPEHRYFISPSSSIDPSELDSYDMSGEWAAEEKHDGFAARVVTDGFGFITHLFGRGGEPLGLSTDPSSHTEGILGLLTPFRDAELACELETGSEAATDRFRVYGYRRLHVFDVMRLAGLDLREHAYRFRRWQLEQTFEKWTKAAQGGSEFTGEAFKRMLLVKRVTFGFRKFYDEVMAARGEGLVLKRLDSKYDYPTAKNGKPLARGKVAFWLRCKPEHHVDYVVLGVGQTEKKNFNLELGLRDTRPVACEVSPEDMHETPIVRVIDGVRFTRVGRILAPPALQSREACEALVGKVVELKGAEVFKSGMLRHGAWVRTRPDKSPGECEAGQS